MRSLPYQKVGRGKPGKRHRDCVQVIFGTRGKTESCVERFASTAKEDYIILLAADLVDIHLF
jgi:hypothetical protein